MEASSLTKESAVPSAWLRLLENTPGTRKGVVPLAGSSTSETCSHETDWAAAFPDISPPRCASRVEREISPGSTHGLRVWSIGRLVSRLALQFRLALSSVCLAWKLSQSLCAASWKILINAAPRGKSSFWNRRASTRNSLSIRAKVRADLSSFSSTFPWRNILVTVSQVKRHSSMHVEPGVRTFIESGVSAVMTWMSRHVTFAV